MVNFDQWLITFYSDSTASICAISVTQVHRPRITSRKGAATKSRGPGTLDYPR